MKISLLLITIFLSLIIYAEVNHFNGITGTTKLTGGDGCICHSENSNDSVLVWIEGPDSVIVSDTASFRIYLTGGPAVGGGFNAAARFGELNSTDTTTQIIFHELTHSFPQEFFSDTVFWNFSYYAPDTTGADTIYSVGNSVNLDGDPQPGDEWNFGENFAVQIIDNPTSIETREKPFEFYLSQNYPNPFNPSTNIQYSITKPSFVKLIVFDVLGNEVTTLISENKQPGIYNVGFRINSSEYSSGVYLYQLIVSQFKQTKKMILLR